MRTRKDKIDTHYIKDIPQNEKQNIFKNIPEPDIIILYTSVPNSFFFFAACLLK